MKIPFRTASGLGLLGTGMSTQSSFRAAREQRLYRRYIVKGSVVLQSAVRESDGALLNLGLGGVLVRTDANYREETELELRFQVGGDPATLTALGQVVGAQPDLLAIKFRTEPAGIDALLRWLEMENCAWSNTG